MAQPDIHSWTNGERPNFRDMNEYLYDVLNWMLNPPMVRLRRTVSQSIPNNTTTAISWDFIEVETVNFWDSTVPTRVTPSVPGWYVGSCGFSFGGHATGVREMNVIKNGSGTERILRVNHDAYTNASLALVSRGHVFLEQFNGTTDYMTVEISQNSGGALSSIGTSIDNQPDLVLRWLAPL